MYQSKMTKLCDQFNVTCKYKLGTGAPWPSGQRHYKVTLYFPIEDASRNRRLIVDFWTNGTPMVEDVLHGLCGDAFYGEETFENFCAELGYDQDSRKAETTWKACKMLAPKLRRFLGEHYETFSTAEH